MVLEYFPVPNKGAQWLKVAENGRSGWALWRPVTTYTIGAPILHLSTLDRLRMDAQRRRGLRPHVEAYASEIYTLDNVGRFGCAVRDDEKRTAVHVLPERECYERVGEFAERLAFRLTMHEGMRVYWDDPADETSGAYTICNIRSEDEIDEDTIVCISNGVSDAEVYVSELAPACEI